MRKTYNFTHFNMLILCMLLKVINKVKVTHQGQGNIKVKVKVIWEIICTHLIICILLQIINMVKVTHQGQGHIKVKVKNLHPSNFMYPILLRKRVVCIRLKCVLVIKLEQFSTIFEVHKNNLTGRFSELMRSLLR